MVHVQPLKAVLPEKKDPASPVKSDLQPEEQEEVVKKVSLNRQYRSSYHLVFYEFIKLSL